MPNKELILIAQVLVAHGIRGEVKLRSLMEDAAEIFTFASLYDEQGNKVAKLTKKSITEKFVIASIAGVTTRNEAELLKGKKFYIKASDLKKLNQHEEFYYKDLLQLKVCDTSLKPFAKIIAIHNFGAGDILEIAYDDGVLEMIIFNKINVPVVNLAAGYLVINVPEVI